MTPEQIAAFEKGLQQLVENNNKMIAGMAEALSNCHLDLEFLDAIEDSKAPLFFDPEIIAAIEKGIACYAIIPEINFEKFPLVDSAYRTPKINTEFDLDRFNPFDRTRIGFQKSWY